MNNIKIAIIVLIIALILLAAVVYLSSSLTGKTVEKHYSYTKAICNESNFCQDYQITCIGNEVELKPIAGAFVQNSSDWTDPRGEETIKNLCG